ncbi:hypothetical protein NQ318_016386 [Aromia moschata]|uniref:Integrase catalytic domain-containing protein n=1 Tax=Aromia moschata TaxID=1265417 RepID=A0AAV8Z3H1_9CUCU|nr:hypothetical protein NQ318_016386 [Aromia moschata]
MVRDAIAFEITGVDFAGPLYLKNVTKAWICLFTCAVFRAALRRFVSRWGRPKTIYSDNGTNSRCEERNFEIRLELYCSGKW